MLRDLASRTTGFCDFKHKKKLPIQIKNYKMDDIDHNRRLKRQNDEKRYNDIADARKLFLKSFSVTSSEYDSQEKYMKKIQVSAI